MKKKKFVLVLYKGYLYHFQKKIDFSSIILLSISTLSISKRYKLLEEMGQNIQERAK